MKKTVMVTMSMVVCMCLALSAHAEVGVTDTEILIGQSCALEGPAAALGTELKAGAEAFINKVNAEGGVNGRQIKLISYNDGYEPELCIENTRKLIETDKVFALFGYVGTPTSKAAIPIIDEAGIPLIGPFTGAGFLRDPGRKVFNIRGTYDQETGNLVKRFNEDLGFTKIACMYQNDGYGKVGLSGVEKGLKAQGLELHASANYERNTTAVKSAVASMKRAAPEAIIMVGAYKPCAEFIKLAEKVGVGAKYANISFVGTAKLIAEMGDAGEGTFISQVVPSPADTSIPVVKECTDLLGRQPTYGELEGFIDAKVLVEGLKNAGQALTRDSFVGALSGLGNYDVGGVIISYSGSDHQGMDDVYLTQVTGGKPVPITKIA